MVTDSSTISVTRSGYRSAYASASVTPHDAPHTSHGRHADVTSGDPVHAAARSRVAVHASVAFAHAGDPCAIPVAACAQRQVVLRFVREQGRALDVLVVAANLYRRVVVACAEDPLRSCHR